MVVMTRECEGHLFSHTILLVNQLGEVLQATQPDTADEEGIAVSDHKNLVTQLIAEII